MIVHTERYCIFLLTLAFAFAAANAAETVAPKNEPKLDPRYPFRTDFANAHLPWYKPQSLVFPPPHSDSRKSGELVSVDFILRKGQFRHGKTGELIHFTMPPYGVARYLNAEADLRDLPLGVYTLFFLHQDEDGQFTRLATTQDQYGIDAGHHFSYRIEEVKPSEGKLLMTKQSLAKKQPDLGKRELSLNDRTRIWKGGQQIKLSDLKPGDELLFNRTLPTADRPEVCTDLWVGAETHRKVTTDQEKKYAEFVKRRGLAGWVDKTEGNKLTVTMFSGDAKAFKSQWMTDLAKDKDIRVCVANDELRTWNPPVDGERGRILEVKTVPLDGYGTSGVQVVASVNYMLEGFRRGRIVRIFGNGWPCKDQPYGESLMGYGYRGLITSELIECTPKEYPEQFPFRTDYGNRNLDWFKLKPGEPPPKFSEHLVQGALTKVNEANNGGVFRMDGSGEEIAFQLIPAGAIIAVNTNKTTDGGPSRFKDTNASVRYLNADAKLSDIPLGTHCRFHLYQDDKGAFTQASLVSDDFSHSSLQDVTYRIEAIDRDRIQVLAAIQMRDVKNYNGDMETPGDIGRRLFNVAPDARVWKGDQKISVADLAVGDVLLANFSGELPNAPMQCTDLWVGKDTHQLVAERQSAKNKTVKK